MYLYMNGEVMKEEEARISPFDHGFLYGIGVFETFRVYDGHPFLLKDHLERINSSLETLDIQKVLEKEEVVKALELLLKRNNLKNAYIRLNVSAGNGIVGLPVEPYDQPNVLMFIKPLPSGNSLIEKEAQILSVTRNTPEGLLRLKSHHYMNNILGKKEIGNRPNVEGIFLTKEGFVAEGIVSNIFWVIDQTLYTPDLRTGILKGITRSFILELAKKRGLHVEEGFYKPEILDEAEEVFVTNSVQEVVAITKIGSYLYPGAEGLFVQELHKEYASYTNRLWSKEDIYQ